MATLTLLALLLIFAGVLIWGLKVAADEAKCASSAAFVPPAGTFDTWVRITVRGEADNAPGTLGNGGAGDPHPGWASFPDETNRGLPS